MTQLQAHPAAGWYTDPSGRHEARYWDGERWTDRVADRGVENADVDAGARSAPYAQTMSAEPDTTAVATMVAEPPVGETPATEPGADPYAALAELRGDDPEPGPAACAPTDEHVESGSEAVAAYTPESVPGPQAGDPPIVDADIADEMPAMPEDAAPEPISRMADSLVDSPPVDEAPDPLAHLFDDAAVDSPVDSPQELDSPYSLDTPDPGSVDSPAESVPSFDAPVSLDSLDHVIVDSPAESPTYAPVDPPVFVDMTIDAPVDPFSDLPTDAALESWISSPAPAVDTPSMTDSASSFDLPPLADLPPFVDSAPLLDAPAPTTPPDAPVDLFAPPTIDPPYAAPTIDPPYAAPTIDPPYAAPTMAPPVVAPAGPENGWYPDPMGRAEVRYWDGLRWTERVATNGVERMETPVADVLDVAGSMATGPEAAGSAAPAYDPDWYPDPTGRHEVRYFDGTTWTEHVANNGLSALDPIADGAPVVGSGAELAASIVPAVSIAASPNATTAEAAEKAFAAALAPTTEPAEAEQPAPAQMPVRPDWAARPNALVGWIVVVGAGVLGIGSVGPWAKATAPVVGDVVQNGMSGDGRFMLALAILLLGTGIGLIMGKLRPRRRLQRAEPRHARGDRLRRRHGANLQRKLRLVAGHRGCNRIGRDRVVGMPCRRDRLYRRRDRRRHPPLTVRRRRRRRTGR